VYLQKRNVVNILFILSAFFYINQVKSADFKSENVYVVEKKSITFAERSLPKSRLLTDKKLKSNRSKQKQKIQKNKQKQEQKQKIQNKIENALTTITIKYLPNKEKPDTKELNILEEAIPKFSNLNSLTIKGYAEKRSGDSSSKVRRLSLKRALFLRELFLNNSFESKKIYVRAMGYDPNISGNKDIVIISTK
jgi:outer membrane protein OmpA-like peptidoglycan-associated protein